MALNIVKVTELTLGRRVLQLGMNGADVVELQNLLFQAGFYLYEIDGIYGVLTLEAIILVQRAFGLKVDGIAGKMVINALQKVESRTGRIIYTVKSGDSLKGISEKFRVDQRAWRSLTGRGNPQKQIYPGMKLLLSRKMLFFWEDKPLDSAKFEFSGQLKTIWNIKENGFLEEKEQADDSDYQIINAKSEIWQELMESQTSRKELFKQCKSLKKFKIGLDLRAASGNTIWQWEKWLRELSQALKPQQIQFLILPLFLNEQVTNRVFWLSLKKWSQSVKLILLDHRIALGNNFELSCFSENILSLILKRLDLELATRILLLERVGGYDWNQALGSWRELSFREVKIIHAAHFQDSKYDVATGLTTIQYLSREEAHMTIYRTAEGWQNLLKQVSKSNLAGIAIEDFQKLGVAGSEMIKQAFAITEGFD